MFLFWTALLMHAAQISNHLPPTRAFGFGMPNQHGGVCPSSSSLLAPDRFSLPGFDDTPRVIRPEYSFWLSPSRNGLDIGSPAEASPFPAVSSLPSGICGFVCVPIVDNFSHGLQFHRGYRPQCCGMAPRRHCGGWCAFHSRRRASASSRHRNDRPPWPSSPSAGESPTSRGAERPLPRPCMCPMKSPDRVVCRATADRLLLARPAAVAREFSD